MKGGPGNPDKTIYFCPKYFSLSKTDQEVTFFHEMSHKYGDTIDGPQGQMIPQAKNDSWSAFAKNAYWIGYIASAKKPHTSFQRFIEGGIMRYDKK